MHSEKVHKKFPPRAAEIVLESNWETWFLGQML